MSVGTNRCIVLFLRHWRKLNIKFYSMRHGLPWCAIWWMMHREKESSRNSFLSSEHLHSEYWPVKLALCLPNLMAMTIVSPLHFPPWYLSSVCLGHHCSCPWPDKSHHISLPWALCLTQITLISATYWCPDVGWLAIPLVRGQTAWICPCLITSLMTKMTDWVMCSKKLLLNTLPKCVHISDWH